MFSNKSAIISGGSKLENLYSLQFDGTDDYVTCGDDSSLDLTTSLTMSVWFYAEGFQGGTDVSGLCCKLGGSPANGYGFVTRDNSPAEERPHFFIAKAGAFKRVDHDVDITANKWYHMAATYDNTTMKLYINGNLVDSSAQSGACGSTATDFEIGRMASSNGNAYEGLVDELSVFNTVLTAAQIRAVYNHGISTDLSGTSGLVAYWRFEEGSGTTIVDKSGNGNTGTLTNGTEWSTTVTA
tara:strand:- start:828 stop:1547 length:720 start_codon:yes stop_codon:yes gene_type:complete